MTERLTEREAELRKRVGMGHGLNTFEAGDFFAALDAVRGELDQMRGQVKVADLESGTLRTRIAALKSQLAEAVGALKKIEGGMTDGDAPDVMSMGRDEFRGKMWWWSQRVARTALARLDAGKEADHDE